MIRLMRVEELHTVLALAQDEAKTLKDVLPHSNVYLYEEDDTITGFTFVIEGYFIAGMYFEDLDNKNNKEIITRALVEHLKEKYDELLIHVKKDDEDQIKVLKETSFVLDEDDQLEDPSYQAYTYIN